MLLYGEKLKTTAPYSGGGFLDFIRRMDSNSREIFLARPRLENGILGRTKSGSDREIHSRGEQSGHRMFCLLLLALMFLSFPALATGSVTLAWNSSTGSAIAGYNLYYGGASRAYTNKITVGNTTSVNVSGLVGGKIYYFAATSYSVAGMESPYSSELIYLAPIVNQPPTLSAINSLALTENAGRQTVSLSDITSGSATENQTLTVSATSSDASLISKLAVNYTSPVTNGSLTFIPMANVNGMATITVIVNDGQTSVVRTFTVTVAADSTHYLIINPLTNLVAVAGQTATFSTSTTRTGPVTYQWRCNGTTLASATNSALTLNNVTTNQAGIYSVTASAATQTGDLSSTCQAATLTVYASAASKLAPAPSVSGQYALTVAGTPGLKYVVQASTNLVNWVPLLTNTAPFTFVDANAGSFRQRFYRSVYAP
jgi:hypothetical protein